MAWIITNSAQAFEAHRRLWDELNSYAGNHILLDSRFVGAQLNHLADRPVYLALDTGTSSPAMILLVNNGHGSWSSFQPPQQPIGNILFADPARANAQINDLLRCLPGYVLLLAMLHQDPAYSSIPVTAHMPYVELIDYIDTGRVVMSPNFDEYWQLRPDDLRENNARRRRRLEREGVHVRLLALHEPDQVEQGLRDYCRMETESWKGEAGTAVDMANNQGDFYGSMLRQLCETGEGTIYELLFNDQPVASQICVRRGPMLVSLKIAYDPAFRRDAPGFLLQEEIIRQLHQVAGVEEIEFYGRASDGWTRKWTDEIRSMYHLNFYRSPIVRSGLRAVKSILRGDATPAGPLRRVRFLQCHQ